MVMINQTIKSLVMELKELVIVYGYMIQNAPTEEARRLVEMNLMTVRNCLEKLEALYYEITGEMLPPYYGEASEEVPVFVNFVDAARYAFKEETQVIRMMKDLHMGVDECYHSIIFGCIVEHQLNAMRMLYLIG
ncbi:MAG: hypothetical protein CVU87_13465 [Firmicutes bacterium HGW-Firmicutes-12]|nr:MAG: hypothetical protein CVU87_13465 [Firmicutes bacterium HGW-Firmicutes-12]